MKKYYIFVIFMFLLSEISAQNLKDRVYIIDQTNVAKLNQIAEDYLEVQNRYKDKQVPKILTDDKGNSQYFSHFDEKGIPIYYSLENKSSAISSKINQIKTGGSTGLDLDGSGIHFGLWEGGSPRATHQELAGKINIIQLASSSLHATHVSGILVATGINEEAEGMAPSAMIDAYTTSGWLGEIPIWAAGGGMITNHSYILSNPEEDYERYGIYSSHSRNWDELSYNAPYLIMCTGASNNGNNNYNPDNSRYDLLATNKLGKNSIVVGACYDVLNYTGPSSVNQTPFTSWGPTDDWRIKPDITAVGISSFSSRNNNDTDYGTGQGSSFAAPIVGGGLALLQQHYHNENSVYMRAATAKALILSTTDEAGSFDGPDFSNGWGLFNAKKAAEVITNKGISSEIVEATLNQDGTYISTITVDGTAPLSVAICWNDPPAEPLPNGLYNDPTPMLINDLDLRVMSDSVEFFPWRMEPNSTFDNYTAAAGKGDNFRDNIEIISVNSIPAGEYTISISHKGSLQSGAQDFSLIVNGIQSIILNSEDVLNFYDKQITVYPNPVTDILNIDFDTDEYLNLKFSLFDIAGQNYLETKFNSQDEMVIDMSDLSNGIYFLKIQNEQGDLISTKKIFVQ